MMMSNNFEENIKKLEEVVKKLENENSNLDESMLYFEKGISLYNECNRILKETENKIEVLNEQNKK